MTEIYVSTDVETDGPIPGPHSMLSLGSAAYSADKCLLATFSANLETLPEASPDPQTAAWWAGQPAAWAACRSHLETPAAAMTRYLAWLKGLPGEPVFVAYPAGFDFLFVYWYLMRFAGESPFSHSALDIKSFAMAVRQTDYRASGKQHMPQRWFDPQPHSHIALDDAIEQGALFCNMLAESRARPVRRAAQAATGGISLSEYFAGFRRHLGEYLPADFPARLAADIAAAHEIGLDFEQLQAFLARRSAISSVACALESPQLTPAQIERILAARDAGAIHPSEILAQAFASNEIREKFRPSGPIAD